MHPKCPSCGKQPLTFGERIVVTQSGSQVAIIWCADCGDTLSISRIGQAAQYMQDPTSKEPKLIRLT